MYGLDAEVINKIKAVFENFPEISKAVLYGSRAKGNHRKGSDIDLTLYGKNLSVKTIYNVTEELDTLYLPYSFDISIYKQIDNPDLIEHINRVGKVFYERNGSKQNTDKDAINRVSTDVKKLPEGWEWRKLGDVCEVINGGTPKSSVKEYWDGDVNWVTPKDLGQLNYRYIENTPRKITKIGLQKSSAKLFPSRSVILSTRAPIGHLAINLGKMSTNQGCRGIVPGTNVFTEFIYYFLFNSVELLNNLGNGATFKELSSTSLKNIIIPLPPLSEQKRIVAILDEAFAAIDKAKANAEKNIANARELFESYLNGIFTSTSLGTSANPGEDRRTEPAEVWEEKKLGDVLDIARGGSPRPIKSYITDASNGINWIKIGDVKPGTKYIEKTAQKIKPEGIKKSRFVEEGDFLLSNSMSFGRPYILKTSGCIHDGWLVLKKKANNIDENYLFQVLGSKSVINQFDSLAAGSTVRNLNTTLVSKVLIPFPSLRKQKRIVNQLDKLSEETKQLESIYQQKLTALDELKKSILKKAFAGEL